LKVLDKNQHKAIFLPFAESAIIEAPPGHGKTFVMARRIEFLIESGYIKPPKKTLGLTFTNAAAGEMLDDIKSRVQGRHYDLIKVMTFHSFCYKILRAYGNLLGFDRNFQIISEVEQTRRLQVVSARLSLPLDEIQYSEWRKEVHLKNNPNYSSPYSNTASRIYLEYIGELGNTKVDYDNLLLKVIELFEKFPAVLDTYRSIFQYILVDEFQDTNPLQLRFLLLLVFGNKLSKTDGEMAIPVFILADEAQAIYRFQAATPENIKTAKESFNCTEIKLDINHRSNSESIINLTGAMRDNKIQASSVKINLSISANPDEEAKLVLDRIKAYKGNLHDIGIIAQNQFILGSVRVSFEKHHIPYVFIPDFSAKSIEKKYEKVFGEISLFSTDKNFNGNISTRIRQVYSKNGLREDDDDVLKALAILASNFDTQARMLPFSERALQFYNDIFVQLNWGNLLRKTVKNKIFLSTIHGVKGLQFAHVHILGLSCFDHIFYKVCLECNWGNNIKSVSEPLSDAQKTLYVGSTRAQEVLYLYSAQKSDKDKLRKVVCLLAPYKDFFDVTGNVLYCGE
jgi:DNA helicase-2/ATP-dependent DNA helicase PcrA